MIRKARRSSSDVKTDRKPPISFGPQLTSYVRLCALHAAAAGHGCEDALLDWPLFRAVFRRQRDIRQQIPLEELKRIFKVRAMHSPV